MLDLNKVQVGDNFSEEVVDNLTRTQNCSVRWSFRRL